MFEFLRGFRDVLNFNADQPRDSHGMWSEEGGSAGSSPVEKANQASDYANKYSHSAVEASKSMSAEDAGKMHRQAAAAHHEAMKAQRDVGNARQAATHQEILRLHLHQAAWHEQGNAGWRGK
jgi:hypothetical protein